MTRYHGLGIFILMLVASQAGAYGVGDNSRSGSVNTCSKPRFTDFCLASTILSGSRQLPWPVFVEKWATFLNSVFFDNCLLRFQ